MTAAQFIKRLTNRDSMAARALSRARVLVVVSVAATAAGCAADPREVVKEPTLSPVGAGIRPPSAPPRSYSDLKTSSVPSGPPHYSTSLWSHRGADLFRDRRARRLGDILTVTISMKDKATLDNRSKRSRDASHGLGFDIGHSIEWGKVSSEGKAAGSSALKSNTASDGKGEIERSESIDLRLAAVVADVLPNGHLLIQGSQEVRVNYELRVLTFTGVVNVADIKADNTIPYERIAEARMSYGGRGRSMEVQQPAWGHQILDIISPF